MLKGVEECVTNQIILSPSLKNQNFKFLHFLAQFMHAGFPLLGYWVSVNFVREGLKKCGICSIRIFSQTLFFQVKNSKILDFFQTQPNHPSIEISTLIFEPFT